MTRLTVLVMLLVVGCAGTEPTSGNDTSGLNSMAILMQAQQTPICIVCGHRVGWDTGLHIVQKPDLWCNSKQVGTITELTSIETTYKLCPDCDYYMVCENGEPKSHICFAKDTYEK